MSKNLFQQRDAPLFSRRTFLKLTALSTSPLLLAGSNAPTVPALPHRAKFNYNPMQMADGEPVLPLIGRWVQVGDENYTQVIAVHAALLPTGKILYFSGDETDVGYHNTHNYDHTRLFDCATYAVQACASPTSDVFCGGHTLLPDGHLLVAGGIQEGELNPQFWEHHLGQLHTHHPLGSRNAWRFDPFSQQWSALADMHLGPVTSGGDPTKTGGRWYPTLITLPQGEVLALSGHPEQDDQRHANNTPEIFSPTPAPSGYWWPMPAVGSPTLDPFMFTYPRLYVLPDGTIFSVSPFDERRKSHRYDITTGVAADVCDAPLDPADPPNEHIYDGFHATSVLLPLLPEQNYQPRVLVCGGRQPYVIDCDAPAPQWTPTAPRALDPPRTRWNVNSVLLPTGEVFVCGGVERVDDKLEDKHAVFAAELYQPEQNRWSTLSAARVPRNYHSVALLMPDGRVWTASSNKDTLLCVQCGERRVEIFEPWYTALPGLRPHISYAATAVRIGDQFEIRCPTAATIQRVALIRTGSVTHGFNPDQRYIGLTFTYTGDDRLVASVPANANLLIPGYYLLFLLNADGIPSTGRFLRIPVAPHWTRWFRLSDANKAPVSASVTAVSSVPGGVSLFLSDSEGAVQSSYYDPRVNTPQWSAWFRLSDSGITTVGATVSAISSVPGGISLFVIDGAGAVQSSYYDPRLENPQWSAWFPLSDAGKAAAGAVVTAISSVPGGVTLFLVDGEGAVQTSYFDPGVANPQWSPWLRLSDPGLAPAGATVSAVSSVPGGITLCVLDGEGAVQSSYYDPRVANPQWSPWFRLSDAGKAPVNAVVSALSSVPSGVSLFLVDGEGALQSSYYDPRVANPQWSPWFRLSDTGKAPVGAPVSAVTSVAGGVSLYVVDAEGAVQSSYYDPRVANPQWSAWFRLSDVGKTSANSRVSAVSTVAGGVSLFVVDREGAVQSSYYDPRQNVDTMQSVSALVTQAVGGFLRTLDDKVTATFLAASLDDDVNLTLRPLDLPSHSTGAQVAIRAFALEARDNASQPLTTFSQPYTLTVDYDAAELIGLREAALTLAYWDGTAWVKILPCDGCTVDTTIKRITARLNHLTEFALLGTLEQAIFLPMITR